MSPSLPRMRWLLAGLLALMAVLAIAAIAAARVNEGSAVVNAAGVSALDRQIRQCEQGGAVHGAQFEACLDGVWVAAVDAGLVAQAATAFAAAESREPIIWTICHRVGHRTGAYAIEQGHDLRQLLREGSGAYCGAGFVHGLLDGLASMARSGDDRLAEAAAACDALPVPTDEYNCAHGLGHAAYQAGHDVLAAMDACARIEHRYHASVCSGGVVMQAFAPDTFGVNRVPRNESAQAPVLVPQWCQQAADRFGADAPVTNGCYEFGAQSFSTAAGEMVTQYTEARNGGDPSRFTREEAAGALVAALDACDGFPAGRRDLCRASQASAVQWYTSQVPEALEEFCSALPQDLQGYCRGAQEVRLTDAPADQVDPGTGSFLPPVPDPGLA